MLSSRDRVLCSLEHEEPDRVPVFVGTSGATTLLSPAYERLKSHLGVNRKPALFSRTYQYAAMDEEVLARLGSDGRPIWPGPAPSVHTRELDTDAFVDEWGISWRRWPGVPYFETVAYPLSDSSVADLERYPWPDLAHPSRFTALKQHARRTRESEFAVVAMTGVSLFEQAHALRGLSHWLEDLVTNPEFAYALLGRLTGQMKAGLVAYLDEVGEFVDVVVISDDLGTQKAPLLSPKMYRRMIKPYHADIIATIKRYTRAKVFLHSDGNVYPLLGDFIEIGVDILNPVQVSASQMGDTARLKREFGKHLSFCGAVDTQRVLPQGQPEDVRAEVRRRIKDLAPGGGYILAAVHCIQPDVAPENVLAMCDEAASAGSYPLTL